MLDNRCGHVVLGTGRLTNITPPTHTTKRGCALPDERIEQFAEFRAAYEKNDNVWWTLGSGEHQVLFDQACEQIDQLKAEVDLLANVAEAAMAFVKADDGWAALMRHEPSDGEDTLTWEELVDRTSKVTRQAWVDLRAALGEIPPIAGAK